MRTTTPVHAELDAADRCEFRAETYQPRSTVPVLYGEQLRQGGLLVCFTLTIFLSATLLFLVQPMVGKMILPSLGGTPAVWNTCMLFFQAVLLAGYGYAHLSTAWLGGRQPYVHLFVLVLPLLVLPIALGGGARPGVHVSPAWWLLGQLLIVVGLPFFVVSTSGPLLQKWFAQTRHVSASDPYFLYAASNAGSLIALPGYPLLIEPNLPVIGQSRLWSMGYGVFAVLVGVCAMLTWCHSAGLRQVQAFGRDSTSSDSTHSEEVTWPRRMGWVLAAFVPSSLMLGVTTHITTNLAPVPLLWVLPLAGYLLTFVLVFARRRPIPHRLMCRVLPFLLPPLVVLTSYELPRLGWVTIVYHLVAFFVAAMVCHGELADRRPGAARLTEFYLWMSVGGVLGGVFNALIAPALFTTIAEYPLAMVLSCLLLPRPKDKEGRAPFRRMDWAAPLALGIVAAAVLLILRTGGWDESLGLRVAVFIPLALICFGFKDRPVRFALGMAVFVAAIHVYGGLQHGRELYAGRNFYGMKRVTLDPTGTFRLLIHGSTSHGKQFLDPQRSDEPLTYYHRSGPLGDIFAAIDRPGGSLHVGGVGLGVGSMADFVRPGGTMTFYEIDPEIVEIARNRDYFTFLQRCGEQCEVVIGDGRLTLAEEPAGRFGLIVLDAFNSDAIPTHLLTREAISLYVDKLDQTGVLAFHISNRYLDLEPLLGALAADAGLIARVRSDCLLTAADRADGKAPSVWVVLARDAERLRGLAEHEAWKPLRVRPGAPVWTDQYTSIVSYLVWR